MVYTLEKIASLVHGEIRGDGSTEIKGASSLDKAVKGDISFVSNDKYLDRLPSSDASAILMQRELYRDSLSIPCVLVENIYESLSELLSVFSPAAKEVPADPERTFVSDSAQLGEGVKTGVFSVISDGAVMGDRTVIHSQVFIGPEVSIGKDCIIYPGVKIYAGCELGDRVIVHANAVIGSDGFGFAPKADGSFTKIPQIGNVIIEDDVEIGANTVIDRASMGSTIIRKGVKLDNLIQIAHSAEIGEHTVMAAQSGVAGSSRLGAHCQVGGQAGIVGHISIADNTRIQAQSGMTKNVKARGTKWYGSPAIDYNNYLKSFAIYKNLPDLQSRINELENRLREVQQKLEKDL